MMPAPVLMSPEGILIDTSGTECCCGDQQLGACCHDEGQTDDCTDLSQSDCEAIPGSIWHPGFLCFDGACLSAPGCAPSCPQCPETLTVNASWEGICFDFPGGQNPEPFQFSVEYSLQKDPPGSCRWEGEVVNNSGPVTCHPATSGAVVSCSSFPSAHWIANLNVGVPCVCPGTDRDSSCLGLASSAPVVQPGCPMGLPFIPTNICNDPEGCNNCTISVS